MANLNPEELEKYLEHCDSVGRNLYSYGNHLIRYDEASDELKAKYRHMAHMSRVWWNIENHA